MTLGDGGSSNASSEADAGQPAAWWKLPEPTPPAVVLLGERCAKREVDLATDDADLYRHLVFAVGGKYGETDYRATQVPHLRSVMDQLEGRFNYGWFADRLLRSPQSRYSATASMPSVTLAEQPDSDAVFWRKPVGAMWTSSFLPDGTSAWQYGEAAEYSGAGRRLYSVHFDEDAVRTFLIDSLDDYRELLTEYPRRYQDGSAGVDWARVADDFDAVRFTARGLAVVDGVPLAVGRGTARLEGWDHESTAWLRSPPSVLMTPADSEPA